MIDLPLRWGDMDSLGHVNNVQFARLFEEARVRAMNHWFGGAARPDGFAMLVARQEIEFVAPLHYSTDPAHCEVWCSRIGGKSTDFGCRLTSPDGHLVALCETTLTVIDTATGRPVELTQQLRDLLAEQFGEPVPFRARRAAGA